MDESHKDTVASTSGSNELHQHGISTDISRSMRSSTAQLCAAGAFSGTCSCILLQPFDLVKTRMQQPASNKTTTLIRVGLFKTGVIVVRDEGVRALWKGLSPALFASHGHLRTVDNLWLGALSRSIADVIVAPVTVIKCRFESNFYKYSGIWDGFRTVLKTSGISGLFSGLVATICRDAPYSGLYLMFYRYQLSLLPSDVSNSHWLPGLRFSAGMIAGVSACAVTQPFDMVKTRMQLFPAQHRTLISTATFIVQHYGYRGFFRGLVPRALRRALMAALAWTVYEEALSYLNLKKSDHDVHH